MQTSKFYKPHGQMSESFLTIMFLSLSGGLQDAYTYILRGEVFANAQTGNIVLFSQSIFQHNWPLALRYFVPLLFFALGVAVAEFVHQTYLNSRRVHWRQLVLAIQILLLFIVGFLPNTLDLLANAMVSFSCAMQVQSFRKVNGYAFASTMCIGNLRSGMESLCTYQRTKNKKMLHKAVRYFGVIFLFGLGSGICSLLILKLHLHTIWISCLLLLVSFSLMFIQEEIEEHPELEKEAEVLRNDLNTMKQTIKKDLK